MLVLKYPGMWFPVLALAVLAALVWAEPFNADAAAAESTPKASTERIVIPVFIDPNRRLDRRDAGRIGTIRFLTEDDYPPFHYLGQDGTLAGFNVDLARMICAELEASCTVQARRWDLLLPAIETGQGDAAIASHRITGDLKRNHEVSNPVYRVPARFVGRNLAKIAGTSRETLAGKTVGVVGGSAHEAYLNALFPSVRLSRFETMEQVLEAMRRGQTDLAFGDGVSIAFWLNGSESIGCCGFVGGPFTESRYFGEGAGIVMRKGNTDLRNAVDFALWRISRDGRFARLYLKYFPVPFY